jgi:hypothetical protein
MKKDKLMEVLLGKQFEMVGLEFSVSACQEPGWYTKHSWTEAQQAEYMAWGVDYLRKNVGVTKRFAESEMGWIVLNFGWVIEEDVIMPYKGKVVMGEPVINAPYIPKLK